MKATAKKLKCKCKIMPAGSEMNQWDGSDGAGRQPLLTTGLLYGSCQIPKQLKMQLTPH